MGDQTTQNGAADVFPRLFGIFFAIFHPTAGPSVIYQVPENFVSVPTNSSSAVIDFDSVSEYVIPKRQLCDRVVSICSSGYRIIGYPIHIEASRYPRNAFIFNCCVVLNEADNAAPYIAVVRRLARVLKSMEELRGSLSNESERGVVSHVIEQVMEDLNNYCECMIPITEEVTLNMKLFPKYGSPQKVQQWHVPVSTVSLSSLVDIDWDLTMQRVLPYIDGVNSVSRISEFSDVDSLLVAKCMEHLIYYGCLIIVDIFQFSGMYAVTPQIDTLVQDVQLQEECRTYVAAAGCSPVTFSRLLELYCSFEQGLALNEWIFQQGNAVKGIDIRRFVQFGVIKGVIYRIHRFPILPTEQRRSEELEKYANGSKHFDEICTSLGRGPKEVEESWTEIGQLTIINR